MKKVKHFIKRHPITIIFLLFFSLLISTLFIQSKIYALSTKADTPGCKETLISCSKYSSNSNINLHCVGVKQEPMGCVCAGDSHFFVCPNSVIRRCIGNKWQGCSRVPCEPKDCDSPTSPHCGTCYEYILDKDYPCTGQAPNCGKCFYKVIRHERYLPKS